MLQILLVLLFASAIAGGVDYGRRIEREPQKDGVIADQAAVIQAFADRDKLRAQLAAEQRDRAKIIAGAVASISSTRVRERAEAAATTLSGCPVDPGIDGLRQSRDAEANAAIDDAYRAAAAAGAR